MRVLPKAAGSLARLPNGVLLRLLIELDESDQNHTPPGRP